MIRRKCRGPADKLTAFVLVRLGYFGQSLQRGVLQEMTQMAKGILIWHQVDSKITASRIELAHFRRGKRAPAARDGFVIPIRERMFEIKLQLVDFKICQVFNQIEECL